MTRRTGLGAAGRRTAWFVGVSLVVAALLAMLPGGRHGPSALIVVIVLGIGMTCVSLYRYAGLRRVEDTPLLGSRRAEQLFYAGLALPVSVFLIVALTAEDNDVLFWGTAILCGAVYLVLFPVMIVSGRRRSIAAGLPVWPPPRRTPDEVDPHAETGRRWLTRDV